MNALQQLKGTYFAIKVKNNLKEINERLIKEGFAPDEGWNDEMTEKINVTHVIVYPHLEFEFHNHDGYSKKIIKL